MHDTPSSDSWFEHICNNAEAVLSRTSLIYLIVVLARHRFHRGRGIYSYSIFNLNFLQIINGFIYVAVHAVDCFGQRKVSDQSKAEQSTQQRGGGVERHRSCVASISLSCSSKAAQSVVASCSSPVEKSEDGCRERDLRWDQTDCGFCQRFSHSRRNRASRPIRNPSSSGAPCPAT